MAKTNINQRRTHIKSLLDSGEVLNYKGLANFFGCSHSAIRCDERFILTGRGYSRNRDQIIVMNENNRAKRFGQDHRISYEEWMDIRNQCNNKCALCGQKIPLTMDHKIPFTKGGQHIFENIQPLCNLCNLRKADK